MIHRLPPRSKPSAGPGGLGGGLHASIVTYPGGEPRATSRGRLAARGRLRCTPPFSTMPGVQKRTGRTAPQYHLRATDAFQADELTAVAPDCYTGSLVPVASGFGAHGVALVESGPHRRDRTRYRFARLGSGTVVHSRSTGISISCFAFETFARLTGERGVKLGFLISPSVDGELGAMIVRSAWAPKLSVGRLHTPARAPCATITKR